MTHEERAEAERRDYLEQKRRPKWTTEPPTVSGFYWVRGVDGYAEPQVALVRVAGVPHPEVWMFCCEDVDLLADSYFAGAGWCGPLEVPT